MPRGERTGLSVAALLSCPVLVALCVAFVDRPAALLAHADFGSSRALFAALTHIDDPLPPLAGVGLAGAGVSALAGWRPGPVGRALIAACIATLVAIALKDQLKYAFGRLWPETWVNNNPSLVGDGSYGFYPFHGGAGWSSFPSGHTTVVAAPAAAVWKALPRWRPVFAGAVALVMVGLFGADYHFVGDMVAGLYLGGACGIGTAALLRGPGGTGPAPPGAP